MSSSAFFSYHENYFTCRTSFRELWAYCWSILSQFWHEWGALLRELLVSTTTGLLAGIYSGLIVARAVRFTGLKNEAKRLIQSLNYSNDPSMEKDTIRKIESINTQFSLISSEFLFLKHVAAANAMAKISAEFDQISGSQRLGEEFDERCDNWQKTIRRMPPSWRVILSLRPSV
jgi:hypothetical protein